MTQQGLKQTGWVFPGQGAQHHGMGKDFADAYEEARDVFENADAILGEPLRDWIWGTDDTRVHATDVAQPGIYVTSVAICAVLEQRYSVSPRDAALCAGLSLGEYTALWASGSLSFEDGLKLVRWRGQFMQAASEATPSGMTSVLGLDREVIREACEQASSSGIVSVANINSPGQIVISGEHNAIEAASAILQEKGAKRLIPLKVAGAFHSEVMRPAASRLEEKLAKITLNEPRTRFLPNTSGAWMSAPSDIRRSLVEQLCSPVLWQKSMETAISSGVRSFVEPGPGSVLKGLQRKIDRETEVASFPEVAALPETKTS